MSSRCRPMRGSFWSALRSRTWTRSTGWRRQSPSSRRTRRAIPARRWRRRRRSTTTCGCCTRAAGRCTALYCDGLVRRDSMDEIAEAVLALGEGTRLQCAVSGAGISAALAAAPAQAERKTAEAGKAARKTRKAAAKAGTGVRPMTEALKARLGELRERRVQPALSARARSSSSPRRSRCWRSISRCRFSCWWIASWFGREPRADCAMRRRSPIARLAK